ncbi:MAG: hypothetical protein JSU96_07755, partial [Acidobacteriota bacterium]
MTSRMHFLFLLVMVIPFDMAFSQEPVITPAQPLDPGEPAGSRPYEIVLADREPQQDPLLSFDQLDGWNLVGENGGVGTLSVSNRQRIWESPTARLVYRGRSSESRVTLTPPNPIPVPRDSDTVSAWMYGNNWSWVPDPATPQVEIFLLLESSSGKSFELNLTKVNWKEWWLAQRKFTEDLKGQPDLALAGIRVAGCGNTEDRELYFENLSFFKEELAHLRFEVRPRRGIELFPGQDPGANRGDGVLPFPTRDTTILPDVAADNVRTQLLHTDRGKRFRFLYQGSDGVMEFCLEPGEQFWGSAIVKINRIPVGSVLWGAGPTFETKPEQVELIRAWADGETARAEWKVMVGGEEIPVESAMRLWQKSLVVDFICRGGSATGLSYGYLLDVAEPELLQIPYMNYGGHHLNVLMGKGVRPFFASIWMDWYRSNASEPFAIDEIRGEKIHLNGGVRYLEKTDGERNDLYERFFVTLSERFEDTLPNIPNPPAKDGHLAGQRLWQETWGPRNHEEEMARSRKLRAYGIRMLTQCNHEIAWRDGGESFTFRLMAAPEKGGDEALKRFVAHQKGLGWRSGLYTNYTDFAPVNSHWDSDMVMRRSNGDLVTAWPRCYSPKALFAVEMDRKLAPQVQQKYGSNAAYTDVHTAVAPWDRTDYDARVPGAGTFAATFYAYGELLLHDQDVYQNHTWSEGHHQWLYAGLTTGNYALTYSDLQLRDYPYLPQFDLLKMHPLTVDIGMPWTAQFFRQAEGWNSADELERSIDRFLAATIAYGHIGWLVEEAHGIRQTARSYYMLQQLQSRYVMQKPKVIRYGSEAGLISSSEALLSGAWKDSRLEVTYENGLRIWVNGKPEGNWEIDSAAGTVVLPPYGWFAEMGTDFVEGSTLVEGRRRDFAGTPEYIFLDGRSSDITFQGVSTRASLAVTSIENAFAERDRLVVGQASPLATPGRQP